MQHKYKIYVLCMLGLLTGCSVGPDYKPVKVAMPAKFKEAPAGWKIAEPCDACDRGAWWLIFNDPELNKLMAQVNVSNQNIAVAVAQYKEAVASLDETRSAYWPTLVLDASMGRQQNSNAGSSSGSFNNSSGPFGTYQVLPNASWSPDIFGAVRRAVEASEAGAQATAAQLADVRLSMQALLAQTYFQLRAADLTQKLLDDTVEAYRKDLNLTNNKYKAGIVSRLDIAQAETQMQTAQTNSLDNKITRAQYEHAIAVLVGKMPEEFNLTMLQKDLAIPQIPLELPAQLLERRPDIAEAERLIAQANANIGVAVAAYFPMVTLTANYGVGSSALRNLFSTPAIMWSIGAALAETIFDGGLRSAQVRFARATYEQEVANYKQTILSALQNVEDNLVSVRVLDQEVVVQDAAVATAQKALDITLNQYNAGIVEYINVIIEQTTAFTAKSRAIDIYGRRLVATVGLIQALGGGWDRKEMRGREMSTAAGQTLPCSETN